MLSKTLKYCLWTGIFIFLGNQVLAQKTVMEEPAALIPPPNGVWLYENVFIDVTEIANIHWLEFLAYYETIPDSVGFVKKMLPDTTVWIDFDDEERIVNYLRYPGFRFFPVVGLSLEQIKQFCAWRSKVVTKNIIEMLSQKDKAFLDQYTIEYIFRLPTEEEWEMAAAWEIDTTIYPYGYESLYRKPAYVAKAKSLISRLDTTVSIKQLKKDIKTYKKGLNQLVFACKKTREIEPYFIKKDNYQLYKRSGNYIFDLSPNKLGLYNIIGNFAEMLQEEGIAKGGSWTHELEDCKIKNRQYYQRPEAWLGFRCVCEVILKKK